MKIQYNGKYFKAIPSGDYNESIFICPDCNERVGMNIKSDCLANHVVFFTATKFGLMMTIECPKCFNRWYCHGENFYEDFVNAIKKGTHKNYKYYQKPDGTFEM